MSHFYNIILLVILLSVSNLVLSRRIPPYIKHNASIFHEKTIYFEDLPPVNEWVPDSWTNVFYKIMELTKLRIRNYRTKNIFNPHDIQLSMPKLFVEDMNNMDNIFMVFI